MSTIYNNEGIDVIELSQEARDTLSTNGVSDEVIEVAIRMTECLRQAGDDVADSTGEDLFDDSTARGQLLYRRGRNRIIEEFEEDEDVGVSKPDGALHVSVDGSVLSFYSARDGLEHPSLASGSKTKRGVVDEMQMQLVGQGLDAPKARRLVLMHEADEDGLVRAALGVLRGGRDWAWSATMFDRILANAEMVDETSEPSYEQQPEAELPAIARRDDAAPERDVRQS